MENIRDLIVARDDGSVEVYAYMLGNVFPILCFECKIKSTITGIDFGNIMMANSKDILLSTYDGRLICLIDSKKLKNITVNEDILISQEEQQNQ